MRRKDKEIRAKEEIESIINRSEVCRIALSENNSGKEICWMLERHA